MAYGQRKSPRFAFEQGMRSHIMGADKTWRRPCIIHDISQTGARLTVKGSMDGINLSDFFLMLSSTGAVYRRCHLVRVAGPQIGVVFENSAARTA